jgi:hypothetical protein
MQVIKIDKLKHVEHMFAMGYLDYKQFSERHHSHIHPPGAIHFVTFRLAGSIPKSTIREYKAKKVWLDNQVRTVLKMAPLESNRELNEWGKRIEQFRREWFLKFEEILHKAKTGPLWMQNTRVAETVAENLHRLDRDAYRLDAFSVMSNHEFVGRAKRQGVQFDPFTFWTILGT